MRGFSELPNGIAWHDTLSDVLGRLDPPALAAGFTAWATAALPVLAGEQVCLYDRTAAAVVVTAALPAR